MKWRRKKGGGERGEMGKEGGKFQGERERNEKKERETTLPGKERKGKRKGGGGGKEKKKEGGDQKGKEGFLKRC
ncbi:hypothetical protein E0F50_09795, partial [Streptococcus pyogenes]|uniref:hypothetical protein n=1 Tax=Streptococcus pyogenes TaxID=1314 RepID=UPI00126B6A54